ncbi:MAG: hypothetical protein SPG61_01945 [Arcanobacterium sp.]|nr:hypothetical protein [Arcanobacterium sp.]
MKRSYISGLAVISLLMGAASTASALSYSGAAYGQSTYTKDAFISITDTVADNKFPAVRYKYNGGTQENVLTNKSGYKTTVSKTAPSKITAIRPCISQGFLSPMTCGKWIY